MAKKSTPNTENILVDNVEFTKVDTDLYVAKFGTYNVSLSLGLSNNTNYHARLEYTGEQAIRLSVWASGASYELAYQNLKTKTDFLRASLP